MKRSILFSLLLLCGYEVVVRNIDPWWSTGQSAAQSSVVRASNFLFSEKHYDNVMVGSSIGNRITSKITADSLPPSFYNLSFGGQSIFDGLLILQHQDYIPQNLFIEMNILMREEDKDLQENLFSPVMFPLKKRIWSLREKHQPVGILARLPLVRYGNPDSARVEPVTQLERDEKTYRTMLEMAMEDYRDSLPDWGIRNQISKLKPFVQYFRERGTNVVFFEVPVDPELCYLPQAVQIRSALTEAFTPEGCKFIQMPDCEGYFTTDAIHLEKISVYRYLHYFREELKRQGIL